MARVRGALTDLVTLPGTGSLAAAYLRAINPVAPSCGLGQLVVAAVLGVAVAAVIEVVRHTVKGA